MARDQRSSSIASALVVGIVAAALAWWLTSRPPPVPIALPHGPIVRAPELAPSDAGPAVTAIAAAEPTPLGDVGFCAKDGESDSFETVTVRGIARGMFNARLAELSPERR